MHVPEGIVAARVITLTVVNDREELGDGSVAVHVDHTHLECNINKYAIRKERKSTNLGSNNN